jgi:hypothetical protein
MRFRSIPALLIATLTATAFVASCTPPRSICDYAADAGTFVGRVEKTHGADLTFTVERLQEQATSARSGLHSPVAGHIVVVHYGRHEEQFLHVGQRYLVTVWWLGHYFSGVHMANHVCSTGTLHADGSAIDTALVHQPYVREVLFKVLIALVPVGLLITVWAIRRRRRQRESVEALLRLGA